MFIPLLLLTAWKVSAQTTVFDVISGSPAHTNLTFFLQATQLDGLLQDTNKSFTVFAPDDNAFAALLASGQTDFNLTDTAVLTSVLAYHVLGTQINSSGVPVTPTLVETLLTSDLGGDVVSSAFNEAGVGGQRLQVLKDGMVVTATGSSTATVNAPDLAADNGVVHSVDAVISPPLSPSATLVNNGNFNILVGLLSDLGLVGAVDGSNLTTYFLPPDEAFEAFLGDTDPATLDDTSKTALLLYHLVPEIYADFASVAGNCVPSPCSDIATSYPGSGLSGQSMDWGTLTVDGAQAKVMDSSGRSSNLTATDVLVSNGVVHVVDQVLYPQGLGLTDLVSMVVEDSQLSTLAAVLTQPQYAGLLQLLANATADEPFTVLAPTDEAFAAAGIDLAFVNDEANFETVVNTLLYHVYGQLGDVGQELVSSYWVETSSFGSQALLLSSYAKAGFMNILYGDDSSSSSSSSTSSSSDSTDVAVQPLGATYDGSTMSFYSKSPDADAVTVSGLDMWATNGIIQKIDQVLSFPIATTALLSSMSDTFSTLIGLADRVGLLDELDLITSGIPFTVVTPTNDAFGMVDPDVLNNLTNHQVAQVLVNHFMTVPIWPNGLPGYFDPELTPGGCDEWQFLSNLAYNPVTVEFCADDMGMLNSTVYTLADSTATVITDMLLTANLNVYAIDNVLLPAEFEETSLLDVLEFSGETSTLFSLLNSRPEFYDMDTGMEWTLFAPTDDAFAQIDASTLTEDQLSQVLLYHFVEGKVPSSAVPADAMLVPSYLNRTNGGIPEDYPMSLVQLGGLFQQLSVQARDGGVYINSDCMVTGADNMDAANIVVHFVNKVLVPPTVLSETASENGFNIAVQLVSDLGLVDLVDDIEQVTAFLPSDAAFVALLEPWGGLAGLGAFSSETLTAILRYHLVPTVAYSRDVAGQNLTVPTLLSLDEGATQETLDIDGNTFMLTTTSGSMAGIEAPDILTSSGAIHGIDAVLIPAGVPLPPVPTSPAVSSSPSPMAPAGTTGAADSPTAATPSASPEDISAGQKFGPSAMVLAVIVAVLTVLV
jgi:uncharacterized surface protein with fasciclin (FAS1) repeats